ncbi:MAG: toll/interleukin-1 receptor domain-containing protein, partial [Rhodococcus sp. (in: high G+C Gram-positive bacteria)]|uniref:toll/interleukin-1 receptor domain-containing protein n=1 Tax=Rhodococcus sp. TaxID=1831 RepID=UPI003BB0404C
MSADLFISYAWTSDQHRQWVRMLAANVRALGYDVLIDSSVDYGNSLSGFMHRVVEARRVLLIVDENYVKRADNHAASGVAIENEWISEAYSAQPPTWLSVLFKDNPDCALPKWLTEFKPKGHWFNADVATND